MSDVFKFTCMALNGIAGFWAFIVFAHADVTSVLFVRLAAIGAVFAVANIVAIVLPWRTND